MEFLGPELEFVKLLPGKDKPSLGVKEMAGEVNPIQHISTELLFEYFNMFQREKSQNENHFWSSKKDRWNYAEARRGGDKISLPPFAGGREGRGM